MHWATSPQIAPGAATGVHPTLAWVLLDWQRPWLERSSATPTECPQKCVGASGLL